MKRIILILCLIFNLNTSFSAPHLTTLSGENLYGNQLKGKWLVLEYWASWCDICMSQLPHLQQVYQKINKNKVNMYLVNYDRLSPSEIQKILNKNHVRIPSLMGHPAAMFGIHSVTALPMTIFINPEGKVHKVLYGPEASSQITSITK
jgi:thiol-disulfide isomerase/thioredoxin